MDEVHAQEWAKSRQEMIDDERTEEHGEKE